VALTPGPPALDPVRRLLRVTLLKKGRDNDHTRGLHTGGGIWRPRSLQEQMHDLVMGLFINRYEFGLSL
jgi:hypothetical protein